MAEPKILQQVSPQGVKFWMIESPQIPMVSVEVVFRAGSAFEPEAKNGLANFTAGMLDEGAGDMDARAFKEALDEIGGRLSVGADRLDTSVNLTTLAEHKDEAARLAALALQKPRFDDDALERVREAILAGIRQGEENPRTVAGRAFMKAVFGNHPYALETFGTEESVAALTKADVQAWYAQNFTRANMVVGVVGAIQPDEAGRMVDVMVAGLPEGKGRNAVADAPNPTPANMERIDKDLPQSTIMMGHVGMDREDPDYYAMLVMNELLGGGVLTSRLFDVVREKNGLVYHVSSANMPMPKGGVFMVQLQTENAKVQKALDLIKTELNRMRDTQPTDEEFADVMAYLVGSFPLRMDSNAKLLDFLTMMQMENLGADYLEKWTARIQAVSKADVQRVAAKLIQPNAMAVTIVGDGEAMQATW